MGPIERFAAIVRAPDAEIRLDLAALWVAASLVPSVDVDAAVRALDDLAAGSAPTFDGVRTHLFDAVGFHGDFADYGDPRNSFLDQVLVRRVGIPITLTVVLMEVARRHGLTVHGIGMPGHFLARAAGADEWCDPYHGGVLLDRVEVTRLFARLHGDARPVTDADLEPSPSRAILGRILTNLEHGRLGAVPRDAATMCELHLSIPDLPLQQQVQLLRRFARVGDPAQVDAAYDVVAAAAPEAAARTLRAEARELRARWN